MSEVVTAAGLLISDCWLGSAGMHQSRRACQMADLTKEDLVEIWWESRAAIEIFVEFEGWAEVLTEYVMVLEVGIEVWLWFGLMG